MTSSLRLAFFCGGTPLLFGTAIFLTWLATGWGWWERAWLWTIGAALICIVAGALSLTRHMRQAERRRGWRPALAAILLLLNLPLGALYMWVVVDLASRYTVAIQNQSSHRIDSLVLSGAGISPVKLGPIPPGADLLQYVRPIQDGKLQFSAREGTNEHSGILENSAGPGSGGYKTIRVGADGSWQVLPGPNQQH